MCVRSLTGQINRFIASKISAFAFLGRILGIVLYLLHKGLTHNWAPLIKMLVQNNDINITARKQV